MDGALEKLYNRDLKMREHYQAWFLWIFIALMVASAVAVRMSVMTTTVRILLAVTLGLGLLNIVLFCFRLLHSYPRLVYPSVFFLAFLLTWGILGSKPYNTEVLRTYYRNRLVKLQNVKYVWGGETKDGIDCSGLARVALWQAMFKSGLMQANPRLLGSMFWEFWFRDLSAKDLLHEKYGYTRVIGKADKLAGYDTSRLKIGDMAVAGDGVHVLIYMGDDRWTEANPDDQKVVTNQATAQSRRGWFNVNVTFVRWWVLDKQPHH